MRSNLIDDVHGCTNAVGAGGAGTVTNKSLIQAMICTLPPHALQTSISILNTRFKRSAQLIGKL
ncbi:MAG: hypothetical protein HRU20_18905 [Pseudomonadales bacterium]|nr:hypothetical protein [Pseudomonadales bacterium]